MKFLETPEEKKSFGITTALFVVMLILFTFLGLSYMDPPPENGIAVNFGNSDTGSGDVQPIEPPKASEEIPQSQPEASQEQILTQEADAPITAPKTEKPKKDTKPTPETKPVETPKKTVNPALDRIKNSKKSEGEGKTSQGDDLDGGGDKGSLNGKYGISNYGPGTGDGTGTGKGTGWGLAGRKLAGNTKKVQDCNESGKVVVKVWVDRQGNVIKAERAQYTTNTNPCLVNPALETARSFKWQADPNAPDTQIGFVVVNFQLGE